MRRPVLIELADESVTPWAAALSLIALSAKMRFTAACASSKLPLMATAWTFLSAGVVIWRRCTFEVPTFGKKTSTSVPSTPAKPCIAAEPVSPDVAVRMRTRLPPAAYFMNTGSIESATSLKAPVLPWKSSRIFMPSASTSGIGSFSGKRDRRRSAAAVRTSAGRSSKRRAITASSASRIVLIVVKSIGATPVIVGTNSPPSGASPWNTLSALDASIPLRVETNFITSSSL